MQRDPYLFAATHLQYFEKGIKTITSSENTGTPMAFQDHALNKQGLILDKIDFLDILETYRVEIPIKNIPNKFVLNIKYSPISFFKKWIFHLSNHALLKVKEREAGFEVEFFSTLKTITRSSHRYPPKSLMNAFYITSTKKKP